MPDQAKRLRTILRPAGRHWVGDGFPVRTLFAYPALGAALSPFLLFDYAGPRDFPPTDQRLGVGEHPHRGFETVTLVISGQVDHRDSSGGGGTIAEGDVQWMTAGGGLVHEEMHGADFRRDGGVFEVVQLWVNLPIAHKMTPPRYQSITADQIPVVEFDEGKVQARVIAGELRGAKGPAETFSPMLVAELTLQPGAQLGLELPAGWTTLLGVLRGPVQLCDGKTVEEAEVALLDPTGTRFDLAAERASHLILLAGEPLHEPIAGRGPFVMTTDDELAQAFADFRAGKMGRLS